MSVIMDLATLFLTVIATTVANIVVLIWLYSRWIIPTIVARTREELMEKIEAWINQTKEEMRNTVTISIDESFEKIKQWIGGKRSNSKRLEKYAAAFLDANLPEDGDLESDEAQSVITDAITKYGSRIVEQLLQSRTPTATAEVTADGWPKEW